jgi:Zn-dependent protease/CBS domain-containing protein
MRGTISLGRVAGIRVGVHWSTLVISLLIAGSLADGVFPAAISGGSPPVYWTMATLATGLFYAALLAHELGHSLVARRHGVQVDSITLWIFGGVSRLHGEAASPGAEARIAGAGPAVSVGVGVLALALSAALSALGTPAIVVVALAWLGVMNLLLAGFNLLPAFPLDGGRILRAVLWRRGGDHLAATRGAAAVGHGFGILLIALGVIELVFAETLGGIWMIFLGWFLAGAAQAEARSVFLRDALAGVRVRDVMSPDPVRVPDWVTLAELVDAYVLPNRFSAFPVRDFGGRVVGMVTVGDIRALRGDAHSARRVRDITVPLASLPTAQPDEPLLDLLERLGPATGQRALVFDADRLVGIVSPADIGRALQTTALRRGPRPGVPTATA